MVDALEFRLDDVPAFVRSAAKLFGFDDEFPIHFVEMDVSEMEGRELHRMQQFSAAAVKLFVEYMSHAVIVDQGFTKTATFSDDKLVKVLSFHFDEEGYDNDFLSELFNRQDYENEIIDPSYIEDEEYNLVNALYDFCRDRVSGPYNALISLTKEPFRPMTEILTE